MLKKLILCLSMFPLIAYAGPYLEFGIGTAKNNGCIKKYKAITDDDCSNSPLGNYTLGYQWNNFSASYEHWSSIKDKDNGINIFAIKYRWEFIK